MANKPSINLLRVRVFRFLEREPSISHITLAPRPHVSQLHGRGGPLMAGGRRPAGVRDGVRTPRAREGAWDPREPRGESEAWPKRPPLPPRAPTMGPDRARPRPRFTAGECLLQTPRTGGRRFPHRGGGSSSGGLRSQRSHSIFGWFRSCLLYTSDAADESPVV